MVKPIREELCEKLELFKPFKQTWWDWYLAGGEAPLLRLVARYEAGRQSPYCGDGAEYSCIRKLQDAGERLGLSKNIHMLR